MSNPYLEKASSFYEFFNDLTGKEHSELKARKHHLEKAIANGDTVEGLGHRINISGQKTYRARGRVALGAAALTAAGLYGAKKYTSNQEEKAMNNLRSLYNMQKQAGLVGSAFSAIKNVVTSDAAKTAGSAALGTAKYIGGKALGAINTARGGDVRQFGLNTFGTAGKSTPAFEKFVTADKATQQTLVSGANLDKLKKLHTQQRVAQVGVYGSAAGISYNYAAGKKQSQQQGLPQSYYY